MEFKINSPSFGLFMVTVDDEDEELVKNYNWTLDKRANGKTYARASVKLGKNKWTYVYLHRLITGAAKGFQVDHKDNNGLNNQKSNLRVIPLTGGQNQFNTRIPVHNTSGYKGVHYVKKSNKYESYIGIQGKRVFGGFYNSALKAAYVYNCLCEKYHGDFGSPNVFNEQETIEINNLLLQGFKPKTVRRLVIRKYRGVSVALKPPAGRPFFAKIMVNNKTISLGYYSTDKEAAQAYNEAIDKMGLVGRIKNIIL